MTWSKTHSRRVALRVCLLAGLLVGLPELAAAQQLDMAKFKGMKARAIGPAGMSGRVTAIDALYSNPDIIYAGTASGGLWKSTNGGIDWKPIFDDQKAASIGAIAIVQSNPDVIYVGTGEGNPRNSQTHGNGMYKTLDGGKTWQHCGLDNSRAIHRVFVDPTNPNVVYAGVQGAAWGDSEDRGVYKSTDGGKTWAKILYVNPRTGVGEMVMDPVNPNKLLVAMWEFRRWPWFFKSGGPGSGLHVTFDGGATWQKRTAADGLPEGALGRMGLAIARSNPKIIYALIESKKNAFYRSDDGGFTWTKTTDRNIGSRPFYYAEIYVDPKNENRIYNLHSLVDLSEDGGKTFRTFIPFNRVHPDHHAWWIHPDNPNLIYDGNDGGMAISRDRGETWRFVENLPLGQFYHISVDMETPYNVYGGLQDNGSWRGPSEVWRSGGIRNSYWEEVAFGDGFDVLPDLSDGRFGYAMSQGGNLRRYDLETGQQKFIKPIHPDGVFLRFNWNAGLAQDPFDARTIYYGSQFLHKSTDRGDTWETISPDLTTNDPAKQKQLDSGGLTYDVTHAENFTTIIAVAPSPVQQGVIWVGTDDGNVQLTTDGGASWTNTVQRIRGVPAGTWVPQIRASTYTAGEAFVVFDNHRRDDWTPYIYHTTDFGRTWRRLVDENKVWGYALAIAQDPVEPKLLFAGTEFGLYVSIDGGTIWSQWTSGFPTVSAMDMVIHPRDHDLIVGTFGRSVYVLDDIRPLRALAKSGSGLLDKPLHVFPAPPAISANYKQASGTRFIAEAEFAGENRDRGAVISFVYNPLPGDKEAAADTAITDSTQRAPARKARVKIEIAGSDSKVIRTLSTEVEPGVNRANWRLDRKGVRMPAQPPPTRPNAPEPGGAPAMPGTYTVRISAGKQVDSTTVEVRFDPRIEVDEAALRQKLETYERFMQKVAVLTEGMDRLRDAKKSAGTVGERIKERRDADARSLKERGKAIGDSIDALMQLVTGDREVQGIRRDPNTVVAKIFTASSYLSSSYDPLGPSERIALAEAETMLRTAVAKINAFFTGEWAAFQQAVQAANVSFFDSYAPLKLED